MSTRPKRFSGLGKIHRPRSCAGVIDGNGELMSPMPNDELNPDRTGR